MVAVSGRLFPMPPGAAAASGGGMAWSARRGKLGLYCVNGRTSELVAAPVSPAELAALAARLPQVGRPVRALVGSAFEGASTGSAEVVQQSDTATP